MEKHGQKSGQMVKDGDVEEINNNKWEMECWSKVSRAIISVPAMEIRGKRGQRQGLVLQALCTQNASYGIWCKFILPSRRGLSHDLWPSHFY